MKLVLIVPPTKWKGPMDARTADYAITTDNIRAEELERAIEYGRSTGWVHSPRSSRVIVEIGQPEAVAAQNSA